MTTATNSTPANSFQEAMSRLRDGDDQAAWDLIKEYEPHLRRVIRRKLDARMQSKFDSIDFAQMVWTSFFSDPAKLVQFQDREHLLQYLVRVAKNKFVDEYRRRMRTEKHGASRECSLQDSANRLRLPKSGSTPSQYAMARERWRILMTNQSQRDQEIVRLRIGGATFDEIAKELAIGEKTVRRVLDRLMARVEC